MNLKCALTFAAALAALGSAGARATTINFDDLNPGSTGYAPISNGYANLNWNNFYVLDSATYTNNPSGYQNGVISPNNVTYNWFGNPASFSRSTAFTLDDLYLTAAWNDALNITITGYRNGSPVDAYSGTLSTSGPTDVVLNWKDINAVEFASSGGIHHSGYPGGGTQFAMDNVTLSAISAVPEPTTWAMLILGVGMIGFAARRRKAGLPLAA